MRSSGQESNVVDLTKSLPQQTDIVHLANEIPDAMSQTQNLSVLGDDVDYKSHTCKDSSGHPSSSLPSFSSSSSAYPASTPKHSSVLLEDVHDSRLRKNHDIGLLFQNLSMLDNPNSDFCKPMVRQKIPLPRLPTSSRSGPKKEKVKKPVSTKKRVPLKFKYYHHPGAMAAITSAMQALDAQGDETTAAQPADSLNDSLVISLKYKTPETGSTKTEEPQAVRSSQHQHSVNRDIMRITSVLNDPAQSMTSPPFPSSTSPSASYAAPSNDDASPSPPRAPSLNLPGRFIKHANTDILNHMPNNRNHDTADDTRSQIAKSGLREEYIDMLTHPERQRYEDTLVEIVGDLELPYFGNRFGSGQND